MEDVTSRDLITSYLTAARSGDWATAYGFFADDLRIRIPGRSEWAGERVGKHHAMEYIDAAIERHAGRVEVELVDMLVSDERVVLLVRERFLGDKPVEITARERLQRAQRADRRHRDLRGRPVRRGRARPLTHASGGADVTAGR